MNWEWIFSALLVSHVVGTLTFFLVALANMWVYNGENRHNINKSTMVTLFLMSNLWIKAWHSGLYGYFCTPKGEEEGLYDEDDKDGRE
ncbi:TMhelix containing protein [Vibrio phage 1.293.O._10N.261.52.E1]|nr:TMhelix containing protein [Vibrio phage 1.293.O._10N.261.52.E1]